MPNLSTVWQPCTSVRMPCRCKNIDTGLDMLLPLLHGLGVPHLVVPSVATAQQPMLSVPASKSLIDQWNWASLLLKILRLTHLHFRSLLLQVFHILFLRLFCKGFDLRKSLPERIKSVRASGSVLSTHNLRRPTRHEPSLRCDSTSEIFSSMLRNAASSSLRAPKFDSRSATHLLAHRVV